MKPKWVFIASWGKEDKNGMEYPKIYYITHYELILTGV